MATGNGSDFIRVIGLNPTGKVPGARFNVNFGLGRVTAGSQPRFLLLIGNKVGTAATGNPAGTAAVDTTVYTITPDVDADALFGPRSELARMIRIARRYGGIRIKAIAVAEVSSGSPVQASATITIANAATSAGLWRYYLGAEVIETTIASGASAAAQATAIAAAFNAKPNAPGFASVVGAVVTVKAAHPGPRGNDITLYQDISLAPASSTSTLATASTYTVLPGAGGVTGVRLGGGSAQADDVSNALAALGGQTFFTVAAAQVDTTNIGLLKTYNDAKAALGSQRYEHLVLGHNGLLTAATTLSDGINKERFQIAWQQGSEASPGELAASMGGLRTQLEQEHPNRRFNGMVLLGIPPQRALADRPGEGETGTQQSALDVGLTPVTSTADGDAIVVRAITTKHFKTVGGQQIAFYGTLDCGQARAPDVFAEELALAWLTEFAVSNEYVDADPKPGEPNPNSGVATPRTWTNYALSIAEEKKAANWFSQVSVTSVFDGVNKQILTTIDAEPMALNHRLAGNVNQTF